MLWFTPGVLCVWFTAMNDVVVFVVVATLAVMVVVLMLCFVDGVVVFQKEHFCKTDVVVCFAV